MEAALAGGIFGLLQGVLFAAIVPFMGEIKTNEQQKAIVLACRDDWPWRGDICGFQRSNHGLTGAAALNESRFESSNEPGGVL